MVMIVLLNDACTCAMPSATFLRIFLRTRWAAVLTGALAMLTFSKSVCGCSTVSSLGASSSHRALKARHEIDLTGRDHFLTTAPDLRGPLRVRAFVLVR